ncbi:CDI toxin immunity protein [Psychrobacter alimentarius]|uniref:CDI toxin immunity protein n=1 Tax=Psychrobacter alimentarius TaxID=261164 RepID=UPI003FCFBE64
MTLFEECKEALKQDFNLVNNEKEVTKLLQIFPLKGNYMVWGKIEYKDYDCMEELLSDFSDLAKIHFYVLADNADIPIFKSNLKLIIDNIYDIMALSPKVYIFDENVVIEPLFPSYTLRVGQKNSGTDRLTI